ncbi:MAG: hypothetical protein O2931_14275 [Planctomycetota bacterium]|nr:hypothetical protein [Planctomycetota bacterium]MDA1179952.1 hypothetical protein [Planctomycetota bacterium]
MFLIGLDEAGYGPNLGPLVIGASVWRVQQATQATDLYDSLKAVVRRTLTDVDTPAPSSDRIVIADSKTIHSSQQGLLRLEHEVLPVAAVANTVDFPRSQVDFLNGWDPTGVDARRELPWYADWHQRLPVQANLSELHHRSQRFRQGLADVGIELLTVHVRSLEPRQFNLQVAKYQSKGAVLSLNSLQLLRDLLEQFIGESAVVVCDKHGGRNQYANFLQDVFELPQVQILGESRASSRYRFQYKSNTVEVEFRTQGETILPTALASMCAKYHRELAMLAWNQFWCGRLTGLRPTAGYPLDAKRFFAAIESHLPGLQIGRASVWRER